MAYTDYTPYYFRWDDNNDNEESEMSIVKKVKNLLRSSDDKLLIKHNVINESGYLTGSGEGLLQNILFEEYKAKMVEKVKLVEAEEKKPE